MNVVVDSNIVFSAILNSQSKIGQVIITSTNIFRFFTVSLLKDEIENHKDKLLSVSGFSDEEYQNSYQKIIRKIKFVDDILIPDNVIAD